MSPRPCLLSSPTTSGAPPASKPGSHAMPPCATGHEFVARRILTSHGRAALSAARGGMLISVSKCSSAKFNASIAKMPLFCKIAELKWRAGLQEQASLAFALLDASVLHAASSARRAFFWLLEPHTKPRRGTRVKIINRCGVASLRQSNRCGSPTICKQAARRRLSAARRGEQQSAKNDHASAARPRPRRRQPPRVDDGQRKRQN